MTTDTIKTSLVINKLTKAQYDSIPSYSDTELYLITDDTASSGESSGNGVTVEELWHGQLSFSADGELTLNANWTDYQFLIFCAHSSSVSAYTEALISCSSFTGSNVLLTFGYGTGNTLGVIEAWSGGNNLIYTMMVNGSGGWDLFMILGVK